MTRTITLCIAIALLSFGLGWFASNHRAPKTMADTPETSFGAQVRDALREGSRAARTRRLANLFDAMRADQVPEAVAVFDRELSYVAPFEVELLFEAWARHDPEAAFEHARNWTAQKKREPAIEATLQSWATEDPAGARAFVDKILDEKPVLRLIALRALVVGWLHSGQPGLATYLYELPEPYPTMGNVTLVGAQTRRLDGGGLSSWADDVLRQISDEAVKKDFFRKVTKALARRDSAVVRDWVDRHGDADYAVDGIRLVVEQGLRVDPEAIMDWSSHLGREVQDPYIELAAKMWMNDDFNGATSYVEAAELTPRHDPIVEAYVAALVRRSEWLSSIDWAQRISDEAKRNAMLHRIAVRWLRIDSDAAETWLVESPLDEEAREKAREAGARPMPKNRGRQRGPAPVEIGG